MPRETAAQKLARRNAELEAAKAEGGGEGKPVTPGAGESKPPKPTGVKAPPTSTLYRLFVLINIDPGKGGEDEAEGVPGWLPLPGDKKTPGEVTAASYTAAMDVALEQARARRASLASEGDEVVTAVRLTVAAIGSRNWNQGTALVELRPVTTWEK